MSRRAAGHLEHLGADRWRLQISAGRDHDTGKRRRIDRTFRGTRVEAERELARLLATAGHTPPPPSTLTVGTYFDGYYLPHVTARVRRRTADGYRAAVEHHIRPTLGDVPLGRLEPWAIDRWLGELAGAGLSEQTRLNVFRVLRQALRQAVRWRMLPADPSDAVTPPRPGRRDVATLTADEAADYLDAFAGTWLDPVVTLALGAGLRRSEILGLTWQRIDLGSGELQVVQGQHQAGGQTWIEPPKSATSRRTVHLPGWAVERLRPWRGIGPVVLGPDGEPATPGQVTSAYADHVNRAGLRYLPLRDLRHTHATLLLASGADVVVVSRRLGHSTVAITDVFYLRPHAAADRAAADGLNLARDNAGQPARTREDGPG